MKKTYQKVLKSNKKKKEAYSCRNPDVYPLNGNYQVKNTVYQRKVKNEGYQNKVYIGKETFQAKVNSLI